MFIELTQTAKHVVSDHAIQFEKNLEKLGVRLNILNSKFQNSNSIFWSPKIYKATML